MNRRLTISRPPLLALTISAALVALAVTPLPSPADRGATSPSASAMTTVSARSAPQPRPNIVLLLTDDMTLDELAYMPNVNRLIGSRGVTFTHDYVPYSLCCPARATILSGQYPHNHGVMGNSAPLGGITAFHPKGSLPTWLRRVGYTTMLIGKYLNQYNKIPAYIPPGWTDWRGVNIGELDYLHWQMNRNGRQVRFDGRYQTNVVASQVENAIRTYGPGRKPFFMYVSLIAPHVGQPDDPNNSPVFPSPNVEPRYRNALADGRPTRTASFNEDDMSDKPAYLRGRHKLSPPRLTEQWQQRGESLLSVDHDVVGVIDALRHVRELDNTIVVFTSDNGFLLGEHRWYGKAVPYEEAVHMPLLVRGPGFPAGRTVSTLSSTVDLASTFVQAAHAHPSHPLDGVPLQQLVAHPKAFAGRSIVLEAGVSDLVRPFAPVDARHRYYWGLRTPGNKVYLEYATGEREYYDLAVDPAEVDNAVSDPANAAVVQRLARWLDRLKNCAGLGCRQPSG